MELSLQVQTRRIIRHWLDKTAGDSMPYMHFGLAVTPLAGMKAESEPWRSRLLASDKKIQKAVKTFNTLAEAKGDSTLVLTDDTIRSDELPWDRLPNSMTGCLMQKRVIVEKVLVWLRSVCELGILEREAFVLEQHLGTRMATLSHATQDSKAVDNECAFRPFLDATPQQPIQPWHPPLSLVPHHSRYRVRMLEPGAHPARMTVMQGCQAVWSAERTRVAALQRTVAKTLDMMQAAPLPKSIVDPIAVVLAP